MNGVSAVGMARYRIKCEFFERFERGIMRSVGALRDVSQNDGIIVILTHRR